MIIQILVIRMELTMKNFLFTLTMVTVLSSSVAFANLDDDFGGDILVIGGTTKKHPTRLSINIDGSADIDGSGWNLPLLEQLTPGKYKTVVFEHVGIDFQHPLPDVYVRVLPSRLAEAYYNLLQPEGKFEFLSHGNFLGNLLEKPIKNASLLESYKLKLEYDKETGRLVFADDGKNLLQKSRTELNENVRLCELLNGFNDNIHIKNVIGALASAGFEEISVQHEKEGIVPETYPHLNSVHISAKKPISKE
jgi:hypothetical protein